MIFVVIVCVFFSLMNQQMQISIKSAELEKIRLGLESQEIENSKLNEQIANLANQDPETLEIVARDQGLSKPDEKVFINIGDE